MKPHTPTLPQPHWLTEERWRVYPKMMTLLLAVLTVGWVALTHNGLDAQGKPLGYDFITFWGASRLALAHMAAQAYDATHILSAEQAAIPGLERVFLWFYPPAFFGLIKPLALMPYGLAYAVFMALTLSVYVWAFRLQNPPPGAWAVLWGFSGLWMNLFHGQNAFLTAGFMALGLHFRKTRPVWAGLFIGALSIKPHLALLFPVLLLAERNWSAFFSAAASAVITTALGILWVGPEVVPAFLHTLGLARTLLEMGALPWSKMPTVFATARLMGLPVAWAFALHGLVAVGVIVAFGRWTRRGIDEYLLRAAFIASTCLISPYLFDYDLAMLAFALLWVGQWATVGRGQNALSPSDIHGLVALWVLPLCMAPLVQWTGIQPAAFLLLAFMWRLGQHAHSQR